MNAFDLLDENEKRMCLQMLKGLTLSKVADIYCCTADDVNNVRLEMIAKFEQASLVKSPETRSFKL